ncbi:MULTISPECIES: 16S rRNA (adenine(1518)-N(6)/adenine(1519)-N(6))-dimethyltransferase RsmA [unclassified Pseudodesulfovibrio]|uniref:16S rRNA (adenine(1518)-N(6)/adenine(1519)-N(6))- dimethyltransferase RsmA n=1 Tax=unclassified Pseudodesulfovibrio TaxID=2661612 RepID=UPI000FEBD47C|nr:MULTISPECIES: 16S rRNA (adenine(1518)-N(6)/adenine(1519)-N(6))-dimethyltransferase RsmA [unclassified Pseudodesulfovibrio]MCJ2163895.1 16S rRNA (adenine(1518)-N(6)/adenine(1519)-N(6))-dimethyltransferase RsmA [Pseudodesulfovibrio sp. S3-i]RWU05860.1 ribosomal RNA small subunit methyltransferase A [Pseudodesulfovibrio sp. S3]
MSDARPHHRAKKSLGQNFLTDQNICRKIVNALDPLEDDHIIEIGPGRGALTEHLVEVGARRLSVIEMDDHLADNLARDWPELDVIRADALKFPWPSLNQSGPCKIIGNLPYNVGSKLIWDIVSQVNTLERAVFMVQHEVALRLTAEPGCKAFGGLTAWVKNFCRTRYLFKVPPTVFRPQPKIDSAVVRFDPLPMEDWPDDKDKLSELIKILFQQRRKQISTILKNRMTPAVEQWFEAQGVDPRMRPENLSPEQFRSLSVLF